jgi:SAM-dependent methyltransferase
MDREHDNWSPDYFSNQLENPKESTKVFFEFLSKQTPLDGISICDAACGNGANLFYLRENYQVGSLCGFDLIKSNIDIGRKFISDRDIQDVSLIEGDIFNLPSQITEKNIVGVTCIQTLSWLSEYKPAILSLIKLSPEWLAFTSLFYDGRIEAQIEITVFDESFNIRGQKPHNVYSLDLISKFLAEQGYGDITYQPFNLEIELAKGDPHQMRTHTIKTTSEKSIQVSGPILMPWYFLFARKV